MIRPARCFFQSILPLLAVGLFFVWPVHALETISPEEMKPGMRGYGLTVLSGSTVERFEVSYLGRLEKALPGQDILLIRIEDPRFEKWGVMAGMSGSPIYFNNKLCGALGYGWSFSKEPIAGVTPIGNMLALKEGLSTPGPRGSSSAAGLIPLSTPVMISGLSAHGQGRLEKIFSDYALSFMPAGAFSSSTAASNGSASATLEPGSAVGVQLVRGDISMTAIGTVTTVDTDGTIYAFGHPFLALGEVQMPMTTAVIEALLPNYSSSFKLGSVGRAVGAVTMDRQPGIAGRLGLEPPMIPLTFHLKQQKGPIQTFRADVFSDPLITPYLLEAVWQELIQGQAWAQGSATVGTTLTVKLRDGRSFSVRDRVFGLSSPLESWVMTPIQLLWINPYESVELAGIEVTAELIPERETAFISGARLLGEVVQPGEPLKVEVAFQPYEGPRVTQVLELNIPKSMPEGSYSVVVTQGRGYFAPDRVTPKNYDQVVEYLDRYERSDQLILETVLPRRGLAVNGTNLPGLPRQIQSVMKGSPETGLQETKTYLRGVYDQPWVLSGGAALNFEVRREGRQNDHR